MKRKQPLRRVRGPTQVEPRPLEKEPIVFADPKGLLASGVELATPGDLARRFELSMMVTRILLSVFYGECPFVDRRPQPLRMRIPLDLGTRSAGTRAVVPEHMGARSERSDEWGRSGGGLRLSGGESFLLSHRGSAKGEHVGVVHESVADGVGDGGIAEGFVPTFGR